jgi:hypothetical protein
MNIHQESAALENLIAQAKEQDKNKTIKPQNCNLDDEECLNCGS